MCVISEVSEIFRLLCCNKLVFSNFYCKDCALMVLYNHLPLPSCVLYYSLRYHNLNPKYIHERLKQLGYSFDLRVLLAQVDIVSNIM